MINHHLAPLRPLIKYLFQCLSIKFTHQYLNQKIGGEGIHSLAAFSVVLDGYRLANMAVKLQLHQLHSATFPCIAHCQKNTGEAYFVVIEDLKEGVVAYYDGQKREQMPIEEFGQLWSGNALLMAPDGQSGEPNYEAHQTKAQREQAIRWVGYSALGLVFGLGKKLYFGIKNRYKVCMLSRGICFHESLILFY